MERIRPNRRDQRSPQALGNFVELSLRVPEKTQTGVDPRARMRKQAFKPTLWVRGMSRALRNLVSRRSCSACGCDNLAVDPSSLLKDVAPLYRSKIDITRFSTNAARTELHKRFQKLRCEVLLKWPRMEGLILGRLNSMKTIASKFLMKVFL